MESYEWVEGSLSGYFRSRAGGKRWRFTGNDEAANKQHNMMRECRVEAVEELELQICVGVEKDCG